MNQRPSCSKQSRIHHGQRESTTANKELTLEEKLKRTTDVIDSHQAPNEKLGMSVFPSIPLAPARLNHAGTKFSTEFSRTLMVGRDLLEPTNACQGGDDTRTVRKALLAQNIESFNSLQRSAWPHIMRGRDCTIIGGTNSRKGKTVAYLAPMAQLCLTQSHNDLASHMGKPTPIGPRGIILYGSSKSCEKAASILTQCLQGTSITIFKFSDYTDRAMQRNLQEDTDFVLTTPKGAEKLFNEEFHKFRFERLEFFVVDDFHLIFRHYMESFQFLIEKIHGARLKQVDPIPMQTIFCGTEWSDIIASATLNICNDPVILLESCMASIQYGDIHTRVHYFADKNEKMDTVIRLCVECPESRIIVVCADAKTTEDIRIKLVRLHNMSNTHIMSDEDGQERARQLKRLWDTTINKKLILVITDPALKNLRIIDADYLIHYDLPVQGKKGAFADRHMCMWENFPTATDYTEIGPAALRSKIPLKSHVFITNEDHEFEKIMMKLHEIGVDIPKDLLEYAQEQAERRSMNKELCRDFKAYGACRRVEACNERHKFTREDFAQEATLPKLGRVQVELTGRKDLTVYIGKLISYHEVAEKKKINVIRYANRERQIQELLDNHFSIPENLIRSEVVRIDNYCVVHEKGDEKYRRGQVYRSVSTRSGESVFQIFLIDCGNYVTRNTKEIYVLPDIISVEVFKPLVVTVYLAGIKPFANESVFSDKAIYAATGIRIVGSTFTGKIVLSVGNEVWVNTFVEYKKGPNSEAIPVRSLRGELVKDLNCGEWNPGHMDLLYDSCERDGGFNCDRYRATEFVDKDLDTKFFPKGGNVNWAFLTSSLNSNKAVLQTDVWCSYFGSMQEIYVQREDNVDALDKLVDELDNDIVRMTNEKYKKYASLFGDYYEVGLPVAVFDHEGKKWNRGMIINKELFEGELFFDLFFVDYGDSRLGVTMVDMFPLKTDFVRRLSFQAIRIGCKHVTPASEDPDLCKKFNTAAREYFIKDDISQKLEVVVKTKEENHKVNGVRLCNTYDSLIIEPKKAEEIGILLESQTLAKVDPDVLDAINAWKQAWLKEFNKRLDELAPDEDSDPDDPNELLNDDDYDVYLGLDCNSEEEKGKMAAEILSSFGILEPIQNAVQNASAPKLAIKEGPAAPLTADGIGKDVRPPKNKKEIATTPPKRVTPDVDASLLAYNGPQYLKPKVEWRQTPDEIVIWIHILDLSEYTLEVNKTMPKDRIIFTSKDPSGYGFELELVGKVLPDFVENRNGQYLNVKLKKLSRKLCWPYLLEKNRNYRWLKMRVDDKTGDVDDDETGYTSEEEEDTPATAMIKHRGDVAYGLPTGYDSEGSIDSDELGLSADDVSDDDDEVGGYDD